MKRIVSISPRATRLIATHFASSLSSHKEKALVVGLVGELGSGKTFFVQHVARALGVRRRMPSPTFLIMRRYPLPKKSVFRTLYHLDAYRIQKTQELDSIQFSRILKDPQSLVLIEWADKIRARLPRGACVIRFRHGARPNERVVTIPKKKNS